MTFSPRMPSGSAPTRRRGGRFGAVVRRGLRAFSWTLGVSALQWALESTATGIVMSVTALTPLTVMPLTRVLEKEKITPRSVLGGAMAVAGVVGLTLAR